MKIFKKSLTTMEMRLHSLSQITEIAIEPCMLIDRLIRLMLDFGQVTCHRTIRGELANEPPTNRTLYWCGAQSHIFQNLS